MDKIDLVIYINLDKRTDRREQIETEFQRLKIPREKILRWSATYHSHGALGCSKSHVAVLRYIMSLPETIQTIVVLEDDFEFIPAGGEVKSSFSKFFECPPVRWNAVLLGYAVYKKQCYNDLISISLGAWLTSGYMLHREGVPKLLANFEESCEGLERTGDPQYHLDVYWEKFMQDKLCFFFNKAVGGQRYSYSDITYGMTYHPSALSDYVEVLPAETNT